MPEGKTIDILLIEDNQDDIFLTDLAIKECNINSKLITINNGKDAIDYLKKLNTSDKQLPALILLDINLPALTGHELLKKIKSESKIRSIPVVILTSSDSLSDINDCYKNGADFYIRKPNSIKDLKKIMNELKGRYSL